MSRIISNIASFSLFVLLRCCCCSALVTAVPSCPKWLQPVCTSSCVIKNCLPPLFKCLEDSTCRGNLEKMGPCMATLKPTDPRYPYACMVPDNKLRNDFLHCVIQEHKCAPILPGPKYPSCRMADVVPKGDIHGDKYFKISDLKGKWHKVRAWKLGEPFECLGCQSAEFTQTTAGEVAFQSNWTEDDIKNTPTPMSVVSHMKARPSGGPGALENSGSMFGLNYVEPYLVVKDASVSSEPFLFFYVCGSTMQGNYTTAFVLGKTPTLSAEAEKAASLVAESIGLKWSDFCVNNNTCFN